MREQFKDYQIKITAGLNQTASATQIKRDLAQLNRTKNRVQLVGQLDRDKTQKNVNSTLKRLKDAEVKISGVLDSSSTASNIQNSLGNIQDVTAKADVEVKGTEQIEDLRKRMDEASNSAAGMAAQVYLARTALQMLRRATREAIETVTELDSAVTDLAMATGQSREKTYALLRDYNKLAGQLGATTTQVSQAADQWLRQGHSISDTTTLIEDSMILSKVSQLDSASATEYLTSAMLGYKVAAQDVLGIVDRLAAVDLESATDAGGLAEAMSRTAVTADMAGVSMNRLLGYLAAVGEVTQKSMSSIGESFKTIFTRMSDIKANKLELIDEDGTVETLSDVELTLKNVGIDLRKTVNEYANYGDVLDNLAANWNTLSKVQQNALAKAFAGTRQGENFRVLMENYSSAMKYMDIAADSAGTATEKFALYTDSIEAKIASFTAALERLTLDTVDSNFVKDLVSAGTAIVEFVDKVGLLKAALMSLGVGASLKGIQMIAAGFRNVSQNVLNMGEAINILRRVGDVSALSGKQISRLGTLTKGLSDDQLKLILTSQQLSSAQIKAILTASGLAEAEAAQKIQTLGLATAVGTATGATWSLSAAVTGLGASIKAAVLSNPIGVIMLAVSALVMAVETVTNAQEEARQAAVEAGEEFKRAADSIDGYKKRVIELKQSLDAGNLSEEEAYNARKELLSIQDEVQDAYGKEAAAIDLVTASANSAVSSLNELTAALANENLIKNSSQIQKSISEMDKRRTWHSSANLAVLHGNGASGSSSADPNVINRIKEVVEKYKDVALETWSEGSHGYGASGLKLSLTADAKSAEETIIALTSDLRELQRQLEFEGVDLSNTILSDDVSRLFSSALNEIDGVIEKYGEIYNNQIQWKIAATQEYAEAMDGIANASKAFKEAVASDDVGALAKAIETINRMMIDPDLIDDAGVRKYMEELIAQMQVEALKYNIHVKLAADVDDDEWTRKVKEALAMLAGKDGKVTATKINDSGITAKVEQKNAAATRGYLSEEAQAWLILDEAAKEYGIDVEGLIPILEQYGYVVNDVTDGTKQQTDAASKLADALSKIKDAYSLLNTAESDMMAGGGLSVSTVQSILKELAEAEEDYLNYLYEENGVVKLNTQAWNEYIATKEKAAGVEPGSVKGAIVEAIVDETALKTFNTAAERLEDLRDAFESLKDSDTLNIDSFKELEELLPGIAGGITSVEDAQRVLNELISEQEKAVKEAYINYVWGAENSIFADEDRCTKILQNNAELVKVLNKNYGIDLEHWEELAKGKWATDKSLVESLSGLWQKYHNMSDEEIKASIQRLKDLSVSTVTATALADTGISRILKNGVSKPTVTALGDNEIIRGLTQEEQKELNDLEAALALREEMAKQWEELANSLFKNDSSSSKSKKVDEYIADIDKHRDAIEALRKAQESRKRIEDEIDNTGSYEKKIALQKELIAAYQNEQSAIRSLNSARSVTISDGVKELRSLGFAVQYNAETNDLWVSNLEHLNDLIASSSGEYDTLQEATNAFRKETEDLIDTITKLNDSNRDDTETWKELRQNIIDATVAQYEYALQAQKNAVMLSENGMDNAIDTNNLANVKKFSTDIIHQYEEMQRTLHDEAEFLRSQNYSDTSDEVSKLSDLWWDYANNIKKVKEQVVDYLIEIVDAVHDSVDEIQNVSDVLHDAADEFAANDGFLTVDTIQALLKLCPQYMQMLKAENGLWEINEERINAVVAARTQQLAVENAMSYVERLKLAAQQGSIEDLNNLCFATTEATASTWGLVYAELELMHTMGELNDSQYQAALHNIQAMQDLAENAIANIGKATGAVATNLEETRKQLEATKDGLQGLLDELKDMQSGADDLVKYVMDMLKHRIKEQISLLEEMKDKYSEIIQLKKDSLDATKDEQDYQKTIAKKLKEMAKLQERINALALDDSRSAQAEQAKLLEQMAELQEDLSETQANKSIEAQKDALDQMEKDYHEEKDEEIKILEDSISSYQKLYDMAINYIRDNWDTLYSELIAHNYEYGSVLNSEITAAWEAAQAAAQRYGDFVSAVMGGISAEIDSITAQIEALNSQISSLNTSSVGTGGADSTNTTVGEKTTTTSPSNEDAIHSIIKRMYANSQAWFSSSEQQRAELEKNQFALAAMLKNYGVNAVRDDRAGVWYVDRIGGEQLYEKYKKYIYHTGGFVGDEPLKPNERYIKAEDGELILTSDQQDSFAAQIDRIGAMTEKFINTPMPPLTLPIAGGLSQTERSTINNITNNSSSKPVTINQGDVVIQGTVLGPKELAQSINKYIDMTEKMVDQYARMVRVKW